MIAMGCSVIFCGFYRVKRNPEYPCDKTRFTRSALPRLAKMELPRDSKAYSYLTAWDNYITAVTMCFFLVYPSIVEQTFGLMFCKELGVCANDRFLREDLSVRCWTANHWSWVMGVAMPMSIVYIIGGPVFVFWCLY